MQPTSAVMASRNWPEEGVEEGTVICTDIAPAVGEGLEADRIREGADAIKNCLFSR